jgi:hypothetical protein
MVRSYACRRGRLRLWRRDRHAEANTCRRAGHARNGSQTAGQRALIAGPGARKRSARRRSGGFDRVLAYPADGNSGGLSGRHGRRAERVRACRARRTTARARSSWRSLSAASCRTPRRCSRASSPPPSGTGRRVCAREAPATGVTASRISVCWCRRVDRARGWPGDRRRAGRGARVAPPVRRNERPRREHPPHSGKTTCWLVRSGRIAFSRPDAEQANLAIARHSCLVSRPVEN